MSRRPPRLSRSVLLAAMLVALAGCGSSQQKFAPACPKLSLLPDAGDLVRFTGAPGAPHDVRALEVAAHVAAVPAHCESAGKDEVRAVLQLVADVRRGPAFRGEDLTIPYFIAITQNGRVLDELNYTLPVRFQPNADQARVTGSDVSFTVPISRTVSAAAFHLYLGFRLTPAELAYNRQAAPR